MENDKEEVKLFSDEELDSRLFVLQEERRRRNRERVKEALERIQRRRQEMAIKEEEKKRVEKKRIEVREIEVAEWI